MPALRQLAPDFGAEVRDALLALGQTVPSGHIVDQEVTHCSYDPDVGAGYIRFERSPASAEGALASPVAGTVGLPVRDIVNVDVDYDGVPIGIEFIGRPDVAEALRRSGAL